MYPIGREMIPVLFNAALLITACGAAGVFVLLMQDKVTIVIRIESPVKVIFDVPVPVNVTRSVMVGRLDRSGDITIMSVESAGW